MVIYSERLQCVSCSFPQVFILCFMVSQDISSHFPSNYMQIRSKSILNLIWRKCIDLPNVLTTNILFRLTEFMKLLFLPFFFFFFRIGIGRGTSISIEVYRGGNYVCLIIYCLYFIESQNALGWKVHQISPSSTPPPWAGCPPPSQAAQSPIQLGLQCLQGWGIHSSLGSPFLYFSNLIVNNFFFYIKSKPTLFLI